jgi:uncharacterized membrane protein YbaN (DUF454 family)
MFGDPTRPDENVRREARDAAGADRPCVVRWLYGGLGLLFVGLGTLGAVLPGLPTTIFLLGATWCFARSFPELSERLLGARLFRPFRPWIVPGGRVSRRSRVAALLAMWAAITLSVHLFLVAQPPRWVWAGVVVALGGIGTWFVVRHGRGPEVRGVGAERASA